MKKLYIRWGPDMLDIEPPWPILFGVISRKVKAAGGEITPGPWERRVPDTWPPREVNIAYYVIPAERIEE